MTQDDEWAWDWAEHPTAPRLHATDPIGIDPIGLDPTLAALPTDLPGGIVPPHRRRMGNRLAIGVAVALVTTVTLVLLLAPIPFSIPTRGEGARPQSANRGAASTPTPLAVSTNPTTTTTLGTKNIVIDDGESGLAGSSQKPGRVVATNPGPGGVPAPSPSPSPSTPPATGGPGPHVPPPSDLSVVDTVRDLVP